MKVVRKGKKKPEAHVELTVYGAAVGLNVPLNGVARLDMTWQEFLADNGMQLTPEDGVYIHTVDVKTNGGWSAEIDERIRDFVSRFDGFNTKHMVELMSRKMTENPDSDNDVMEIPIEPDHPLGEVEVVNLEEEEEKLQGNEVQELDIKSFAQRRLQTFSNEMLLKVRKEIRKLKSNNQWERVVIRCPLACYLVEELFNKDYVT